MTNLFAALADRLDPIPNPLRDDVAEWCRQRTGEHLWSKQVEIAEALVVHRKVAVRSAHGTGKSFSAARITVFWIDTRSNAYVVTSAPTTKQVEVVLWREIRSAFRKVVARAKKLGQQPPPGNVLNSPEWKVDGQSVAIGRKPADHDDDGFQGLHADELLVVLDEAGGIPASLWVAAGTLTTNDRGRQLAIGNPDHAASEFAEVCKGAPTDGSSGMSSRGWWVITISAFDTPAFTGEWVPSEVLGRLTSRGWVDEKRVEWGEDSPLWMSKVLGQFPTDAADGVVPWSWLRQCQGEESLARVGPLRVPVELGVDVGGGGQDETVIAARQGPVALAQRWRMSGLKAEDSEVITDRIIEVVKELNATAVKLDANGVGHGVVGSLKRRLAREVPWEVAVHGVMVSEAAPGADATKFVNLRAWLWWTVGRELSRTHGWDLTAFDNDEGEQVLAQLAAPRYFEKNGRVQIESKDEVRKRLKRSTDDADALLLAFYVAPPETPPVQSGPYENRGRRAAR